MEGEVKLNKIVSNIINENSYSHCRLCLKEIEEEFFRFEDLANTSDTQDVEFLPIRDVLSVLDLEAEIAEEISGIDAICSDCLGKALESVRFINQCKKSTTLLSNVLKHLSNTLNDLDSSTTSDRQKLYLIVSEHNTEIGFQTEEVRQESNLTRKEKKKKINKDIEERSQRVQKIIQCSECKEGLDTIEEVIKHNITYHSCLTCNYCLETFPDETELEFHVVHKHKYKCDQCPQLCLTQESLEIHYDGVHRVFYCKKCGKSCKGLDKLNAHEQHHNNETNVCPKCGKTYQTRSFFLNHTKLCTKGLLDPHPIRSNLQRTFSCEKCGKGYSTSGGLRVHMRFEHGAAKYHVCKECGKKFTAPSCLKTHMVTHTGEKNFQCIFCDGKFVSKAALLYHTRRHTGERPYSCHVCQGRFVNASARAEHIKHKHVGPTLQCQLCPRKFLTTYVLKKHMTRHHNPSSKLFLQSNHFEFVNSFGGKPTCL